MRATYKILEELIDFPFAPDELAERFTMTGSEVEKLIDPSKWIDGIVAAKIIEVDRNTPKHELSKCTVTDGKAIFSTLSGAPDIEIGLIAPFAKPGAKIFGDIDIGIEEINGDKSEGMLCSGVEVGLGMPKDSLLHLPDNTVLGADISEILGYNDERIYEFEITPNRPDCYGLWGLAREIAAITGKLWEPIILHPDNCINDTGGVTVVLDTPNCPRYVGRLIEGIRVKRSPLWLMSRLSLLGMRPINNIVDLTNYVMLLTGQPIHAFDADKLGKTIIVRQARVNESIITLDEEERKLSSDIMMIATPEQSVAIAGVMGGINTEVDNDTRNILVEVANFSQSSVRRAKKITELNTESSMRFERGVDPQVPPFVADIVAYYTEQLTDAQTIHTSVDEYPHPVEPDLITLTSDKVKRLLGINIPTDDTRRILVCLGFDIVSKNADGVTYEVPSYRPDATCEADLVEEVGRIYGLDLIEPLLRAQGPIPPNIPDEIKFDHFLQSYIAGLGFRYAFCDPLGNRSLLEIFAEKPLVELSNPISEDLAFMRPNPLPMLIATVARNLNRGFRSVRMFEIDFGYYVENEYIEKKFVTLVCGGMRNPIGWNSTDEPIDFYDIKGVVEAIGKELNVNFEMNMIELPYAKPRTALSVKITDKKIGYIGTLNNELWSQYELKKDVHFAVLNFEKLLPYYLKSRKYKKFSRFPAIRRDVALIIDEHIIANDIIKEAKLIAPDAEEIGIFDMYRGDQIPQDKKSLGIYFTFRALDRTLTDEEVNKKFEGILRSLCNRFNATIRK